MHNDNLDTKSIEILTRWKAEHIAGYDRHIALAASATSLRDIKNHTEQAEMHRDAAEGCTARLARAGITEQKPHINDALGRVERQAALLERTIRRNKRTI